MSALLNPSILLQGKAFPVTKQDNSFFLCFFCGFLASETTDNDLSLSNIAHCLR